MFHIYENGKITRTVTNPRRVEVDGAVILNLSPEVGAPDQGVYPVVSSPVPAFDRMTERAVESFEIEDGKSVQRWEVVPLAPEVAERLAARAAFEAATDYRRQRREAYVADLGDLADAEFHRPDEIEVLADLTDELIKWVGAIATAAGIAPPAALQVKLDKIAGIKALYPKPADE